jgi:hypothetical protein
MTNYIINPFHENYIIEKYKQQKNSFNFLNNRNVNIEDCTFIFLNKSKYSKSSKDFMKEINKYIDTNIVIYLFHFTEIKEYIKPFDLSLITKYHFANVFEYFNDSNYTAINEDIIIEFMTHNNFKNNYVIYK